MNPAGKVVVVTGTGSGMGREIALDLLRRGARVAAVDINVSSMGDGGEGAGLEAPAGGRPDARVILRV